MAALAGGAIHARLVTPIINAKRGRPPGAPHHQRQNDSQFSNNAIRD
jgi:hypothetical protein